MKKIVLLTLLFALFSCWASNKEITDAKKEIFGSWVDVEKDVSTLNTQTWSEVTDVKNEKKDYNYYEINPIIDNSLIVLSPIMNVEDIKDKLDLSWNVNDENIDKITVSFSNRDSSFPEDKYELKTFKKWDKNFSYKAYSQYKVLDKWLNTYQIDWYANNELVASISLNVFLSPTKKVVDPATLVIDDKTLPTWEEYGELQKNENWIYTYTNLKDFSLSKNDFVSSLTCENLWDYLQTVSTFYYWNTCRPIKDGSFWVNTLTLDWDNYTYSKMYFDTNSNYFVKVILQTWTWITKDDLEAKNMEFKSQTFEITTLTDKLFSSLIK